MAYAAPTPDDLRLRYPAFAAVSDETIAYWLTEAAIECALFDDATRARAEMAYAAHMMVETGALSGLGGMSVTGVTSFKSGDFSATLSDAVSSRTGLSATAYGREFMALRRRQFGGPFLAGCV